MAVPLIKSNMDRQKTRKQDRRFTCDSFDFPVNGKEHKGTKNKYKKNSDRKRYEMNQNSYMMNWQHPRMHPVTQRQFSTSDSSVCHYSVPLSFSFEPVSLPIYSALIQPPGSCPMPFETDNHSRIKHHRSYSKNKHNKANSIDANEVPAMFHTPRIHNGDQQDYTSLPPVNCDMYASKTSDTEAASKRRFSDPGIGQLSSDEGSSSRFDESSNSSGTAEPQTNDFFSLIEQVNELKESNSSLKKELHETRLELESLKIQSQTWKSGCDDFKPGALSDAISEIRNAVKLSEEALISKVIQMLEKNSAECREAQSKLEENLKREVNERLSKIEKQLSSTTLRDVPDSPLPEFIDVPLSDSGVQQQLAELQQEKLQLRKELQEAVTKRKVAEATTEKLERLVGVLRKKINGVSLESCMSDEKHIVVRPLASSLEKNPFIIANNRQGPKPDPLPAFKSPKMTQIKVFALDGTEGVGSTANENKENEAEKVSSDNNSGEMPSVTAQVTITGPVTDL